MRRLTLGLIVCLTALAITGCASRGVGGEATYTYNQKQAGNIAASDSLGAGLCQHTGVQTAFVPDDN
jgi:hypothetical protein